MLVSYVYIYIYIYIHTYVHTYIPLTPNVWETPCGIAVCGYRKCNVMYVC